MADNGAVTPLYDPGQTVEGGGGDLLLKFYGPPGSGFEFCEISPQSLTRGSQYQFSFLPEMKSGVDYKLKVNATYKDFIPQQFDLTVKYLPNLDGKTKFVDLGTHIFYRSKTARPKGTYKFTMDDVINDEALDPYDFTLTLKQSTDAKAYYKIEEQEEEITLDEPGIPRVGENYVSIWDDDGDFSVSRR